jgi:hypothetical protein
MFAELIEEGIKAVIVIVLSTLLHVGMAEKVAHATGLRLVMVEESSETMH